MNVRTPQLLTDLYRDLRDRRLLVPALALAVALIAVPMALSSSAPSPTAPATTPATSEPGKATAAEPAVLTRELGVTAYRRRLERVNGKNPFNQQFTLPEVTSKVQQSSLTEPSSTTSGVTTSGGGSTSSAEPTAVSSTSPGGTGSTPPASEPGGAPGPTLYVFELDLSIGIPGELSRRKHVELGKFLPSEAKPMLAFAGITQDMKHALFLVSDDVSSVDGDGRCVPGPNNCRLLRLKVGDEAKLAYAPEGDRTYKLKLHGVDLAPFDASPSNKRGKRGSDAAFQFALAARR
ncbi:MAG: hypothetical protein AABM66_10610 [Actinomycetota bacterium]